MTNVVDTSANRRNQVLHLGLHFNPSSLDSKLTKKRKDWEEQYVPQGTKGCRLKYKQNEATMDYSFFTLQFLPLQSIQEAKYIALQRGNGGSCLSVLKAYGRPRENIFELI